MTHKAVFLTGLFILCACVMMLQIIETRVLSVISYYHLAFLAISMAMFGMTAGSLIVYFNPKLFEPDRVLAHVAWISSSFAVTVFLSTILVISTVLVEPSFGLLLSAVLWLKLIVTLVPPYVCAGMAISLALTRSPWPVSQVYGADLAGAAFGCLGSLVLLSVMDGVSAMLMVGALGAAASVVFHSMSRDAAPVVLPRWLGLLHCPGYLAVSFAVFAVGNAVVQPHGLRLSIARGQLEDLNDILELRWNSYSRIKAGMTLHGWPHMWGASSVTPWRDIDQRFLSIDGDAGTAMYRFSGDIDEVDFLKFDISSLAYNIRNQGRAAVIGVGGGRDLLTAYVFGFRDVTGVELNPIFVDFLSRRFRDFNHLVDLPGVHLIVDEARSWFASTGRNQQFDLVQMSMIDTWAATGVGAFSLSENGLYTVEGWRHFLTSLAPTGIFTVSRWYSPDNVDETGRLVSLAKASLLDLGVEDPSRHLLLAATANLATLVVGRAPLTPFDLAELSMAVDRLGFKILLGPDVPAASEALRRIAEAPDSAALARLSTTYHLDLSPPTDDRPFFFNQLRITDPAAMAHALSAEAGVVRGNMLATFTLLTILVLSFVLVLLTIVVPALPSIRQSSARMVGWGTGYFLLVGLGFMFVEIGLIQRLSLFLGHPVYGLAVSLFGIILTTGLGSFLSDRIPLDGPPRIVAWCTLLVAYLWFLPYLIPPVVAAYETGPVVTRGLAALALMTPLGLLMGFGFPTGMRLINAIDTRPTPWFWAINGAAGVLASSIAVAMNITFSISISIWLGAGCYLLVGAASLGLLAIPGERHEPASKISLPKTLHPQVRS